MAARRGAEGRAVAQAHAVGLEVRGGGGQTKARDVHPQQVGGLDGPLHGDAGEIARELREQEIAVTPQVIEERLPPRLAVAVRRLAGAEP